MFCSKCGKELKEGARFCSYCGAATAGEKEYLKPVIENISGKGGKPVERYKSGKVWLVVAGVCLVVGLLLAVGILAVLPSMRQRRYENLIAEGNRYLEELNYEGAIVAFTKAIEIDPKQAESYLGRAESYYLYEETEDHLTLALSDYEEAAELETENIEAYLGMGKTYEQMADLYSGKDRDERLILAVENYEHVQRLDPSESISCERLIEIYKELGQIVELLDMLNRHQNESDSEELKLREDEIARSMALVKEIESLCAEENIEGIFSIMQSKDYEILQKFFSETGTTVLMTENGKGLGLYHVITEDYGNMMIYYGEYEENKRHGEGMWLGFYNENNYYSKGKWEDDLPNGEQEIREWNGRLNESVVIRMIKGTVSNGYWNGPVEWGFEEEDETKIFTVSFTNGKWDVLEVEEDEGEEKYIVSNSVQGHGRLVTHTLDKLEGIEGFVLQTENTYSKSDVIDESKADTEQIFTGSCGMLQKNGDQYYYSGEISGYDESLVPESGDWTEGFYVLTSGTFYTDETTNVILETDSDYGFPVGGKSAVEWLDDFYARKEYWMTVNIKVKGSHIEEILGIYSIA